MNEKDLASGKTYELKLHRPLGEEISLQCKVKWSHKTPPLGRTNSIGMEIIDPPLAYEAFFKTL
jgi:hypothetical protein